MTQPDYKAYTRNRAYLAKYDAYQRRYRAEPRESDKVMIGHVRSVAPKAARILDVGCSTGNLLYWMREALPDARLFGAELAASSLDACRSDPELAGIEFQQLDVTQSIPASEYDVITVNAVFYCLTDHQFEMALDNVRKALRPGGSLVAFDFFHGFDGYSLEICERSRTFPEGHMLRMRPMNQVRDRLAASGFAETSFYPFVLPIDLPLRSDAEIMTTYTRRDASGERLAFRGVLYQPWCHLVARCSGA